MTFDLSIKQDAQRMTTRKAQTPNKAKSPAVADPALEQAVEVRRRHAARMAVAPSVNGASVIEAYQGNIMGKDVDISNLVDNLRDTFAEVKDGNLRSMEAMLISQATALQTIFTSLARRAQVQESQRNVEAFLGLALKAQAQSRATISALVDLKYPRQATFVKQANIAHGPQQVNNGAGAISHAQETQPHQNKLLEADHGGTYLDPGATTAPARSHQAVAAVEAVHRPEKLRG